MTTCAGAGVTPSFIIRFQLGTAAQTVGTWQASVQAHVWRDVWVAHSDLARGELVGDADVARERRDVLGVHESLAGFSAGDNRLGSLLANRSPQLIGVITFISQNMANAFDLGQQSIGHLDV